MKPSAVLNVLVFYTGTFVLLATFHNPLFDTLPAVAPATHAAGKFETKAGVPTSDPAVPGETVIQGDPLDVTSLLAASP